MSMPEHLVLVRHGESEANIVQKMLRNDPDATAPEGFYDRHDRWTRLSALGQHQAIKAGHFILEHFRSDFDRYYVSSLSRTIETAGLLAISGKWQIDDRWRERDWGEYGRLNDAEREAIMPQSKKIHGLSKWDWCPPGGESLATGVTLRFRSILDSLHREMDRKKVIAVTHGEMIEVARATLERLTPEEWMEQEKDPNYKLPNGVIVHYSRRSPDNALGSKIAWRRVICPWNPLKSWNDGKWTAIVNGSYSDQDLLDLAEQNERLLED